MSNARFGFRASNGLVTTLINGLGVYESDAQLFINAAGITDVTQKDAISQLVLDLKSYGIWTKMRALYPFVGGTASAHSYNLKNPAQYQITWFGGMTHDSNGITGNGSNAYGFTNFPNNAVPQLSNHISVYSRSNYDSRGAEIAANTTTPIYGTSMQIRYNGLFRSINQGSSEAQVSYSDSLGLYMSNRINVSQVIVQKNNIQNTISSTANTHTGSIFHLLRQGDSSTFAFQFSPRNLAFASIGEGFTQTEASNFYLAVQKFQITLGRSVGGRFVTDPDAQAFVFSAQISDQTQANAVDNLVISLKNAGLWTKMKAIYPFVGGTATTHSYNLKDPRNENDAFRLSFVGGWTHSLTGALPNGTNAYAETFFNPLASLGQYSTSFSYYSRTNSNGAYVDMGCEDGLNNRIGLHIKFSNIAYYDQNNTTTGRITFSNTGDLTLGLFLMSRTSNILQKAYSNGVQIGSTNVQNMTSNLPNATLLIGALKAGSGTISNYTNRQVAFATIGDGLNDSEASALYNIVQTYQTALGRQVP